MPFEEQSQINRWPSCKHESSLPPLNSDTHFSDGEQSINRGALQISDSPRDYCFQCRSFCHHLASISSFDLGHGARDVDIQLVLRNLFRPSSAIRLQCSKLACWPNSVMCDNSHRLSLPLGFALTASKQIAPLHSWPRYLSMASFILYPPSIQRGYGWIRVCCLKPAKSMFKESKRKTVEDSYRIEWQRQSGKIH